MALWSTEKVCFGSRFGFYVFYYEVPATETSTISRMMV